MSIEKPISTIRKVIHGAAEELASKESLQIPETKHYDKVVLLLIRRTKVLTKSTL